MTSISTLLFKTAMAGHVGAYKLSGGRIAGGGHADGKVVLLTTTGRKSGKTRTAPLMHFNHGDAVVVVGSAGGADHHPGWYHNLVAQPEVTVQLGREVRPVRARVAEGPEREELWAKIVDHAAQFGEYTKKTSRVLPVVVLDPR